MANRKSLCKTCGKEFYGNAAKVYCSDECKQRPCICQHCGKQFITRRENTKYCSVSCKNGSSNIRRKYHYRTTTGRTIIDRDWTGDSDLLLVVDMRRGKTELQYAIDMYRSEKAVKDRVKHLKLTGRYDEICADLDRHARFSLNEFAARRVTDVVYYSLAMVR